jgi:4-hydroxy-3-methylbut-2-enyl diphosphate reductase IspH
MSTQMFLKFSFPISVPKGVTLSERELGEMTKRAADFLQWELNEFVKKKTGIIQVFGVSELELKTMGERENAN